MIPQGAIKNKVMNKTGLAAILNTLHGFQEAMIQENRTVCFNNQYFMTYRVIFISLQLLFWSSVNQNTSSLSRCCGRSY